MQVFLPKWQNFLILKNAATIHSARLLASYTNHYASFHSTDASFDKWKPKANFNVKGEKQKQPSKDRIRFVVREKRSASKKALKDLLLNTRFTPSRGQAVFPKLGTEGADWSNKKTRLKPAREARGAYHKKGDPRKKAKSKHRREKKLEDFDEHERIFQEDFGDRCFTWSFKTSETEFDWKESSGHGYFRNRKYKSKIGGMEFNNEPCIAVTGSVADRRTLGLPLAGQIKIEDVKTAFRLSALKWHPDKNQGPSRAAAEEKFKLCADAYKSLCSALSVA